MAPGAPATQAVALRALTLAVIYKATGDSATRAQGFWASCGASPRLVTAYTTAIASGKFIS